MATEIHEENDGAEELFEHHRLVADAGQQPLRVDKFVTNLISKMSRSRLQASAKAGYVRVNGESVKPNFKVKSGDVVTIEFPNPVRTSSSFLKPWSWTFIRRRARLVLNKSAGLVVHPGNGNYTGTLVHGVAHHLLQQKLELPPDTSSPDFATDEAAIPRPGLVHRLDKDTTGVWSWVKPRKR